MIPDAALRHLFECLQQAPLDIAVESDTGAVTRGEIAAAQASWHEEFDRHGIARGDVVALRAGVSAASISLLLALFANGNIVVPLSPATPDIEALLNIAGTRHLASFDDAGDCLWDSMARPRPSLLATLDGAAGLVVFTSGSSGQPKAALHNVDRLLGKFRTPRRGYRTLTFLTLDHLGGINTVLAALHYGGTAVVAGERSVEGICAAVERHRIELLPVTPTFLKMLLIAKAQDRWDLSSIRLVTYGAEPMPPSTLDAVRAALPGVGFKQTYGLTELGVLPTRSEAPGSLWMQVGGDGVETRIEDRTLRIRTRTAMLGYLNAPSPFDADGWYDTDDIVEQRDGWLRIVGRRAEAINVAGAKVFPAEVEDVLLSLDNVRDATVYGMRNPLVGQIVVAQVQPLRPEDAEAMENRILAACAGRLDSYKVPAMVEIVGDDQFTERYKKIRNRGISVAAGIAR